MPTTLLIGVDDSEESLRAVAAGLELLPADSEVVVATVIEPFDPMLVTGTGIAGGTMSTETFEQTNREQEAEGARLVEEALQALGLTDADARVVRGNPGPALCDLAAEVGADAVVIGSRGRGGIKRAVLGSVSDHVVRNAPCPVVVTGPADDEG